MHGSIAAALRRRRRGVGSAGIETFFDLPLNASSLPSINTDLTINGTTKSPDFVYFGQDASASGWTAQVGENLTINSASGSSYSQPAPMTGTDDRIIKLGTTTYLAAQTTGAFDTGTNDFVVVAVTERAPAAVGGRRVLSKSAGTTGVSANGWAIYNFSTTLTRVNIKDASLNLFFNCTFSYNPAYDVIMLFVDHGTQASAYVNGYLVASQSLAGLATLSNGGKLQVGDSSGGCVGQGYLFAAGWSGAGWLDSSVQADVAHNFFQRVVGLLPTSSKGSSLPSDRDRGSLATLESVDANGKISLHPVSGTWTRVCSRKDTSGVTKAGVLIETASTNLALQSEDFSTTWAKIDAGDTITTNSVAAPNGRTTADSLIGDSTDGQHGVTQAVTLTAATYTLSVYAKAGDQNWLYLSDDTVSNADAYFNLSTGAVGTVGAAATAMISAEHANGFYRCSITFTGTVASHTVRIASATADTDDTFAGDGAAVNTYVWGAQCEQQEIPTSYIATTTGTATRAKDELQYVGTGNIPTSGKLRVSCNMLVPNYNYVGSGLMGFSLNDGGSIFDQISLYLDKTGDVARASVAATAGNSGSVVGTVDVIDGDQHAIQIDLKTDSLKLFVDSSQDGPEDTSVDVPNDLDRIEIGQNASASAQPNGLISNLKIQKV